MNPYGDERVPVGSRVMTYDQKYLGTIDDCTTGYFKVRQWWGRDYWLNEVLIRDSDNALTTLHISRQTVDRYKLPLPPNVEAS